MSTPERTLEQPRPSALPVTPATLVSVGPFEPCEQCGAAMDRQQRYCVSCGTRSGSAANPASRYFAAASRRRRLAPTAVAAAASPAGVPPASSTRTAGVFFFALLPIAVAVGVMVGRNGSSGDEQAIIDALRDGKVATATASTDAGAATVSNTSDELLPSDFSLDKGYTVELDSLPIDGTDQAAADAAKKDAEGKGAKDVGIINPGDFRTTPDQGQQDYILYSGEYSSKAEAQKALGGLKKDFPAATVIGVTSSDASAGSSGGGGGSGDSFSQGKVIAHTSNGDVHAVAGAPPPTEEDIQESTAIVNQIANQEGADYTDQQQQLPDVIPVGGDPNDAPPLPTGGGD